MKEGKQIRFLSRFFDFFNYPIDEEEYRDKIILFSLCNFHRVINEPMLIKACFFFSFVEYLHGLQRDFRIEDGS